MEREGGRERETGGKKGRDLNWEKGGRLRGRKGDEASKKETRWQKEREMEQELGLGWQSWQERHY